MGEAKKRAIAAHQAFPKLDGQFREYGIDTTRFGFYDQLAFQREESRDPAFLEQYAKWVLSRPRDAEYNQRVQRIVPKVADLIANAFIEDEWHGSCVAASGMLSRVLDRLGIWSYAVLGSAIFEVPHRSIWRGLQLIDDAHFVGAQPGHSWVVAPPFQIVDGSIFVQRWGNDPILDFLPKSLIAENAELIRPTVDDFVSADVRTRHAESEGTLDPHLHLRLKPRLSAFNQTFKAVKVQHGALSVRYTPAAVRQTDVPLEQINVDGTTGRTGKQIWDDVIHPAMEQEIRG